MVILTDLSEVLIHGMFGVEENLGRRFGPEVGDWFLRRRTDDEINNLFCNLMRGKLHEDDYWRIFLRDTPYKMQAKVVPGTLDVYKRIVAFPRSFRNNDEMMICGMPDIYIVSDHISERIGELREYHPDIFSMMSGMIWSCDRGKLKSDDRFFQGLLREMRLSPWEVVFVDDLQINLLASARANILSICFHDAPTLEKTLAWRKFEFSPKAN